MPIGARTRAPLVEYRLRALDGVWRTIGRDYPTGITAIPAPISVDDYGPADASFTLIRNPTANWPDLFAFTPVDILINGAVYYSGRIRDTPTQDELDSFSITVNLEGGQADLDDDAYERVYVLDDLSAWQDIRSNLSTDLTKFVAAYQVSNDVGGISISIPQSTVIPGAGVIRGGGVYLDLGPNSLATRIVVGWTHSNNEAGLNFGYQFANAITTLTSTAGGTFTALNATATGTASLTITGSRYVLLALYDNTGGNHTPTADVWCKITSIKVFTSTAYESGGVSVLTTDLPIRDALDKCCPALDADRSSVAVGTWAIPSYRTAQDGSTPRDVVGQVNALQNYQFAIDAYRRPIYRARPTIPEIETWAEFADTSANSGQNIYSAVIGTGTAPDGTPIYVRRLSGLLAGAIFDSLSSAQPTNPGFEVNTTGWTISGSTVTLNRDTATFDAGGVASGRVNASSVTGAQSQLSTTVTGLVIGRCYQLSSRFRATAALLSGLIDVYLNGVTPGSYTLPVGSFVTRTTTFVATATSITVRFDGFSNTAGDQYNIDNVQLMEGRPTLVEKSGRNRTGRIKLQNPTTAAILTQVCDVWLAGRTSTPLAGTVTVHGAGDTRAVIGGASVEPHELLLRYGEMIRLARVREPNTGASHRDGRIVRVTYTPPTYDQQGNPTGGNTADVSIDNTNRQLDAFLARLAVVSG